MEDSNSTAMEVVPTVEKSENVSKQNSTDNSVKPSNQVENKSEKKIPGKNRRLLYYRNKLRARARAANIRRRYNAIARNRGRGGRSSLGSVKVPNSALRSISFDLSEYEKKMLEFYKVKLSVLKGENENLHSQLKNLTKENTRLLLIPIIKG